MPTYQGWTKADTVNGKGKAVHDLESENCLEKSDEPEIATVLMQEKWVSAIPTMPEQTLTPGIQNVDVLVDTGAMIHVCPRWSGSPRLVRGSAVTVRAANGQAIQRWGQRKVSFGVMNETLNFLFEVADVRRPILRMGLLNFDTAFSYLSSPQR